jgi:hypothetical protein
MSEKPSVRSVCVASARNSSFTVNSLCKDFTTVVHSTTADATKAASEMKDKFTRRVVRKSERTEKYLSVMLKRRSMRTSEITAAHPSSG